MSWIHSFAVTDTQTHKNGYTIYKITSIVFPRAIPQALTCITVWKRFHDIKKLHRELSRRQKSLKILEKMPVPTDSTYFKRFDANVIARRREFIVEFLDFVAQYPALYKCHIFFQFFNDSTNPNEVPLHKTHIEKSRTTHGCPRLLDKENEKNLDNAKNQELENLKDLETSKELEKEEDTLSHLEQATTLPNISIKPSKDNLRFLTPMASIESIDDSDYIYEAALEFSHAVQAEVNLEYGEAHMRYKRGVELLLSGCQYDTNEERKFIAKTKISKYLARADDIFDKFLANHFGGENTANTLEKGQLQLSFDSGAEQLQNCYIEYPLNQLAKYKVIKIIGERVLQVKNVTDRQSTYVIKGIEKPPSNAPTQTIFLPQHVPYMVELLAFFQSEQKLYLLLKYAEGGRLSDSLEKYTQADLAASKSVTISEDVVESPSKPNETSKQATASSSPAKHLEAVKLAAGIIKQWARELFVAIESLHEKGVILGDLQMKNLLLDDKNRLLLTYFYQNQTLSQIPQSFVAQTGHFVAPERPVTFKSDWWSYGVVLYELLVGMSFKAMHPGCIDIYGCVQYPENIDLDNCAQDLLENLLQQEPEQRFDAKDIKDHEFFSNTDWMQIYENGFNFDGQ